MKYYIAVYSNRTDCEERYEAGDDLDKAIDEAKKRADKEESEASDWLPRIKNVSVCIEDKFNNILFEEVVIDR